MPLTEQATSHFAQAGSVRLHYNEAGNGDALIGLHGGGPGATGWSNWRRNIEPLSEHFRVILVDLPGYGKSDKPMIEGGRFAFYARAIRDLMDQIGIDQANFLGSSWGAATTLKFALDYPDRAIRLVCMAAGGSVSLFTPMPTEGIRHLMGYYAPPGPSKEKMEAFIRTMVSDQSLLTEEVIEERYQASIQSEMLQSPPPRGGGPVTEEVANDLTDIPHKTLLISGRDDRVVPMDGSLFMLQRLPDAQLHIFSRCGHWAQWEKTDEFNQLVIGFLKGP